MRKLRLDDLVVERGLATDLKEAAAIILSGVVLVNEQRVDKPGSQLSASSEIRLKTIERKYVSRGGLKLEVALRQLAISVQGKVCLDLGASTGGFTDCLLCHGARKVYAFDVGRGQLHWRLQQDPRVVMRDAVNVRHLVPSMVNDPVDLISVDVSFISLRLVLPPLRHFPSAEVVALVKPQFEARRDEVGKGGIIGDVRLQRRIVARLTSFAEEVGIHVLGEVPSPIAGQKGNREYFVHLRHRD